MTNPTYLLTPGPLTTSEAVRSAMHRDWGSRDQAFIDLTARIRSRLCRIANADAGYSAVPIQGSGTFAVEAMVGTFAPKDAKTLVLVNGAYGSRIGGILQRLGRPFELLETDEDVPSTAAAVEEHLNADANISHVVLVHCETTSGIYNDLDGIAAVVHACGRALLVDAMSSFGALPIDAEQTPFQALAASSNKCLQGAPGVGHVICQRQALEQSKGNCHAVSLDLYEQWVGLEANGQWRFTPPTHVLAALDVALDELETEGGPVARLGRYAQNCEVMINGLLALGFELYLARELQAPIIVTFKVPNHPNWDFERFYGALQQHGFTIYPGKLTREPSFRIGCIGALDSTVMEKFVVACGKVVHEMGLFAR
ncbi:MAG: 2-aminoethylphosphonate--pyruvate transaminase [Chromatiales bacterium]|jgi:2-aminoethylphosphonate-pyruvate transaminase|nr:2-aminoethylphosphonate--pyruvate transaminase [Chromatiales bacterium]